MALLIDEYGGFTGVVTMEDLLEEIVGEIDDEYDYDDPDVVKIADDTYRVQTSISVKDFNYETGSQIPEDSEDFDTIGGFIIYLLGYIPEDGDTPSLEYANLDIEVLEVKDKRIVSAKITVYDDFTNQRPTNEEGEIDE